MGGSLKVRCCSGVVIVVWHDYTEVAMGSAIEGRVDRVGVGVDFASEPLKRADRRFRRDRREGRVRVRMRRYRCHGEMVVTMTVIVQMRSGQTEVLMN